MNSSLKSIVGSSILRKQIIALTGLAMIGFVIAHLAGNLTIYFGPEAFNGYAEKLHKLGALLWVMRGGLIAAVIIHIGLTLTLVFENRTARQQPYQEYKSKGDRSWATRTMAVSGILIVVFIVIHLYDFTFATKDGPQSVIEGVNEGQSVGLFGVVWYSFNQWWRVGLYILAMAAVGAHLSHAVESVFQTFGLFHKRYTPWVKRLSIATGVVIFLGFSAIPVYILLTAHPLGA